MLHYKSLAEEKFSWPTQCDELLSLTGQQINWLLDVYNIEQMLEDNALIQDYLERPAYQQNDYIGWTNQAKQEATKQKRLNQMLVELKQGGVYMKMVHPASAKK